MPKPDNGEETVNHPAHYQHPSGVEAIVICEHEDFCRGNAIKYLMRAGKKGGADEVADLEKAVWYIQRAIARIKKERWSAWPQTN